MWTIEKCSNLYTSLKRLKTRCNFKYSMTKKQGYLKISNEVSLLLVKSKYACISDIDLNELENNRDELYFKMRYIDNNCA